MQKKIDGGFARRPEPKISISLILFGIYCTDKLGGEKIAFISSIYTWVKSMDV